ncbi:MAG TPA: calcineurin-like phosphoesterase family protein [Flavisolibacter sp.]|nr:calcineurin-like phosphoesterase family protein [Flavisolibacter sp.]
MQRRRFLQSLAWLTGGLLITRCTPAKDLGERSRILKGSVLSNGKGVANVVVSDGYNVVVTDKRGRYEFPVHKGAVSVFVSIPSGHAFVNKKNIAKHYHLLNAENVKKALDFNLTPLSSNDDEHQFIIWADPQVRNKTDVAKMMAQTVPDVQRLVASTAPGTLIHGITVGDIAWDDLTYFSDYSTAVEKMGIPFFQCLGNHDMDYNLGGDETSDKTFQKTFGPTYYSFNRGQVHYVVMDDVRYLGKEREYDGYIQPHQLEWLKKDLSLVPSDKLIVLSVHIPVHNSVKNNAELYQILEGRQVHIMSGHTHYHVNIIKDNIYEHNHGTVCGAWWTGAICGDGTPNGYGVYKVKGKELSWHYQSTGKTAEHQMSIYANNVNSSEKQVLVNIWNYDPEWKTEYWVDGVNKGALEQIEGFDPIAYATLLGPDLPNQRAFAEPKKTNHLFKAIIPATAKEIRVVATDRFGKMYNDTHSLA